MRLCSYFVKLSKGCLIAALCPTAAWANSVTSIFKSNWLLIALGVILFVSILIALILGELIVAFPLLLIKWGVAAYFIRTVSRRRVLYVTIVANLVSKTAKILLAVLCWWGFLGVNSLILGDQYGRGDSDNWNWILVVSISLLSLEFLVGYFLEQSIFRKMVGDCVNNALIKKAVLYANIASHVISFLLIGAALLLGVQSALLDILQSNLDMLQDNLL